MPVDLISPPLTDSAMRLTTAPRDGSNSPLVVRVLFYAIAALLTFTAVAKLWMVMTDPLVEQWSAS